MSECDKAQNVNFRTFSSTRCSFSSSSIGVGEKKSLLSSSIFIGEIACNDSDMTLPRNIRWSPVLPNTVKKNKLWL